jgi:hypothetical protein
MASQFRFAVHVICSGVCELYRYAKNESPWEPHYTLL